MCEPDRARVAASGPPVAPFTNLDAKAEAAERAPGTDPSSEKADMARVAPPNAPRYTCTSRNDVNARGRDSASDDPTDSAGRSRPRTSNERTRAPPRSSRTEPPVYLNDGSSITPTADDRVPPLTATEP